MSRKRLLLVFMASVVTGILLGLSGNIITSTQSIAQAEMSLGSGKRKVIKVDFQRVVFPHKKHQELVLKIAGGDKEMACRICHHKKRNKRDPRACRRCHAGKMQKAKGTSLCLSGCHVKKNRPDIIQLLEGAPNKKARPGQRIKLKDAFHLNCKNCHAVLRSLDLDLDATKYMAPVEYCEGCHVPKSKEDEKMVEAEKEVERKRTGSSIETIRAMLKEQAQ